jgi:hypothetical protein
MWGGPSLVVFARVVCGVALAATVGLASPAGAGAVEFSQVASYQAAASNSYATLRSGDFNGDGIPDLAVATQIFTDGIGDAPGTSSGNVEILLGRGDGSFATGGVIPIPGGAEGLVVGDFNGDRHPDLAVGDGAGGNVVLLGRGDGTFEPPGAPATASLMDVAGDFNHDGFDDLVAYDQLTYTDELLLGGPGGKLVPGPPIDPGADLDCAATIDMNGDGKLDLICAPWTTDGTIDVLLGRGDGTFDSPIATPSGLPTADAMTVGDVNGDGHPDVVVTSSVPTANHLETQQISVLLGHGDGTLGLALPVSMPDRESFADGPPTLADFNGDGELDILTSGWPGSVLLGNGDGSFRQPLDLGVYDAGTAVAADSSVVADFNGDGRPDIATVAENEPNDAVGIYINGRATPLTVTPTAATLAGQAIGSGAFSLINIPTDKPVYWYLGSSQLVDVNNPGDGPVALGRVTLAGADPGDFAIFNDFCSGATLAGGQTCSFYAAFAPTATGPRTATAEITNTPPGGPSLPRLSVSVSGVGLTGTPPASTGASRAAAVRLATPCTLGTRAKVSGRQVTVAVRCDRRVTGAITGTLLSTAAAIRIAHPGAAALEPPKAVQLTRGHTVRLTVALNAVDHAQIGRAIAHHRKVHLRLTLIVRGASGARSTLSRVDTT